MARVTDQTAGTHFNVASPAIEFARFESVLVAKLEDVARRFDFLGHFEHRKVARQFIRRDKGRYALMRKRAGKLDTLT